MIDEFARAMFNNGLDEQIENPTRALAVVMAVKRALREIAERNEDFRLNCEVPVYSCDLSQLNVKCSTRMSGSLPTILDAYALDPYQFHILAVLKQIVSFSFNSFRNLRNDVWVVWREDIVGVYV
jgi:hypothetical protein